MTFLEKLKAEKILLEKQLEIIEKLIKLYGEEENKNEQLTGAWQADTSNKIVKEPKYHIKIPKKEIILNEGEID